MGGKLKGESSKLKGMEKFQGTKWVLGDSLGLGVLSFELYSTDCGYCRIRDELFFAARENDLGRRERACEFSRAFQPVGFL